MDGIRLEDIASDHHFSKDVVEILHDLYQSEFLKVVKAISQPPLKYYVRVNTLKKSREEVQTILKEKNIHTLRHPQLKEALYLERRGPFEVPIHNKMITIDKFTAESVLQGANVYAPGIISCKKIKLGDSLTVVDEFNNPVASGIAAMSETQILTYRKGLAVFVTNPRYSFPSLRETSEFNQGLIYPQSFPSMITSHVLDPQPSEIIVDLNCAPGGKLSHICQLTNNKGKIIGIDRTKRKIQKTKERLNRLSCKGVTLIIHDSRYLDVDMPQIKADKCLIDPPCSALGLVPKVYEHTTRSEIKSLAEYQKHFLKVASKILKPGGIAVYSVCTITKEECEDVIEYSQRELEFETLLQKPFLGCNGFNIKEGGISQRFHPHIHGLGYFIAKLKRK